MPNVYIKSIFKKNQLKFLPHIYYEDNVFYSKMLPLAERVMYIPQKLYKRRYRNGSITMVPFDMRHAKDYLQMIQTINNQNHDKQIRIVICELLGRHLNSLIARCNEANLLDDEEFLQELYRTAMAVCNNKIGYIDSYFQIENLYQIINIIPKNLISIEDKNQIKDRKRQVLKALFSIIPLSSEEKYVGIYGRGIYTERFLNEYKNNVGKIKAKMIFIDSYVKTGKMRYQGYNVFNINDIGEELLDCIVVSSSKYEREMCLKIEKKYKNKFRIVSLFSDLHF